MVLDPSFREQAALVSPSYLSTYITAMVKPTANSVHAGNRAAQNRHWLVKKINKASLKRNRGHARKRMEERVFSMARNMRVNQQRHCAVLPSEFC
jgi:hypothetical protein